ncbi:MAG: hypothetical protein QNK37_31960, partial [Acidobacteriota bacterium]|nr:hypothetical protein [Acidobacteriota bacterium]
QDRRISVEKDDLFPGVQGNEWGYTLNKMHAEEYVQQMPRIHRPGTRVEDSGVYDAIDEHGCFLNFQIVAEKEKGFPEMKHPRAIGYILHLKEEHVRKGIFFHPGQEVLYSGVYEVVDANKNFINRQVTCMAGDSFPPMIKPASGPMGKWYVLSYRAAYSPYIFLPGEKIERSGSYYIIDHDGFVLAEEQCERGEHFADFGELHDPYGYVWKDACSLPREREYPTKYTESKIYNPPMPRIHRPGTLVEDSGVYDVIDVHGCFLDLQIIAVRRELFPMVDHPRAIGYILHIKEEHDHKGICCQPNDPVHYSGVYDVINKGKNSLDYQATLNAEDSFPPITIPGGVGYVLAYRARYAPYIYLTGEKIETKGTYRVIDYDGRDLNQDVRLEPGIEFPAFDDLRYFPDFTNWKDAYGYTLKL